MSKAGPMYSSIAAALSVGAVCAPSAPAAIEFKWKVGGTELKSGETRGFTMNNDEKRFTLHGFVSGIPILLLSTLVSALPNSKVIGGIPGTALSTIVFLDVTVDNLVSCSVTQSETTGRVQTAPLKIEIVEGAVALAGRNEVDILFIPENGTLLATFQFAGSSCPIKSTKVSLSGTILGLALPQKIEALRQNVVFEATSKEYRNHAGEFVATGLNIAGSPASLEGLALVALTADQVFGPF
jgi:hypothetical protein